MLNGQLKKTKSTELALEQMCVLNKATFYNKNNHPHTPLLVDYVTAYWTKAVKHMHNSHS